MVELIRGGVASKASPEDKNIAKRDTFHPLDRFQHHYIDATVHPNAGSEVTSMRGKVFQMC